MNYPSSFKMYPISCETCNNRLACLSMDYNEYLRSGMTVKESLDALDLTDWCCKCNMMTPPEVKHDMENREIIEGIKSVEYATLKNARKEAKGNTIFKMCDPKSFGTKTIGDNLNLKQLSSLVEEQEEEDTEKVPTVTNVSSIDEYYGKKEIVAKGKGIDIQINKEQISEKFNYPIYPGVPTYNPNSAIYKADKRYVGANDKHVIILTGVTYLAR